MSLRLQRVSAAVVVITSWGGGGGLRAGGTYVIVWPNCNEELLGFLFAISSNVARTGHADRSSSAQPRHNVHHSSTYLGNEGDRLARERELLQPSKMAEF